MKEDIVKQSIPCAPDTVAVGIGVPGLIDRKRRDSHAAQYRGCGEPASQSTSPKKQVSACFMENDAHCFALGETLYGRQGPRYRRWGDYGHRRWIWHHHSSEYLSLRSRLCRRAGAYERFPVSRRLMQPIMGKWEWFLSGKIDGARWGRAVLGFLGEALFVANPSVAQKRSRVASDRSPTCRSHPSIVFGAVPASLSKIPSGYPQKFESNGYFVEKISAAGEAGLNQCRFVDKIAIKGSRHD